jgi:UDP-N-acetylglucosamine 2-epimerase (non-hydrolysing)
MKTILIVAGTRPEIIKTAPVVIEARKRKDIKAALCSFNMKVPVAHIEAGLRSFNTEMPYPEECDRRLISVVSKYNFCPTNTAYENLKREGISEKTLHVTGNTVVDALHLIKEKHGLDDLKGIEPGLKRPFVLITAHRRESFGEGLKNICSSVRECAAKYPDHLFVYPVHLNPNVKEPVHELLGNIRNVILIPPVPYLKLLTLLKHCEFVISDSGGIQEEAPSFGKYCIVLREVTERTESVDLGMSELVGTDVNKILDAVSRTIEGKIRHDADKNPYGDGHASEKILDVLAK